MVDKITTAPTDNELIAKVNEVIDDKQDTLVSGTNIKTINGNSVLGSGNLNIETSGITAVNHDNTLTGNGTNVSPLCVATSIVNGASAGASAVQPTDLATVATTGSYNDLSDKPTIPTIDNSTITTNTDDELQTVGIKDNNDNTLKMWTGTKAQYDAITTKDNNTLYNITDDTDITMTLLQTIYPVGSIYITTNATCPLQALGVGTWQLVAEDRVLQGAGTRGAVGTTVNESLPNIKGSQRFSGKGFPESQASSGTSIYSVTTTTTGYFSSSADTASRITTIAFDASRSSSTYKDNAPVQQNAFLVNIWKRIG